MQQRYGLTVFRLEVSAAYLLMFNNYIVNDIAVYI